MWACFCALATYHLKRPVKYSLQCMGNAHDGNRILLIDFKIGLTNDFKILAYEATFHQNAGSSADLSPAVSRRTLFPLHQSFSSECFSNSL